MDPTVNRCKILDSSAFRSGFRIFVQGWCTFDITTRNDTQKLLTAVCCYRCFGEDDLLLDRLLCAFKSDGAHRWHFSLLLFWFQEFQILQQWFSNWDLGLLGVREAVSGEPQRSGFSKWLVLLFTWFCEENWISANVMTFFCFSLYFAWKFMLKIIGPWVIEKKFGGPHTRTVKILKKFECHCSTKIKNILIGLLLSLHS